MIAAVFVPSEILAIIVGALHPKKKKISSRNLPMEYTDLGGGPKIDVFGWVGLHIDKK